MIGTKDTEKPVRCPSLEIKTSSMKNRDYGHSRYSRCCLETVELHMETGDHTKRLTSLVFAGVYCWANSCRRSY